MLEMFFILCTSFILCLLFAHELFFSLIHEYMSFRNYYIVIIISISALAVCLIVFFLLKRHKRVEKIKADFLLQLKELSLVAFSKLVIKVFCLMSYNHILLGIIFFFLLRSVTGIYDVSIFVVISACIVAWTVGFVTPGAPGGIGVKEAILSLILADFYGREYVLVCALLFRIVTVSADVLTFSFFMILKKIRKAYGVVE